MQALIAALFVSAWAPNAFAIVDMKNANFAESWTDISVPGTGYDLRVTRAYNSRSLFNGIFGFGWCSEFESTVAITPEGNLKLTECGAGLERTYIPKNFKTAKVDQTVESIIAEVKKRRKDLGSKYLEDFEKELRQNDVLREEFGRRLDLKGKVEESTIYYANGRENETLVLKSGTYKRTLVDGTYQIYDSQSGKLIQTYDRNSNYLKLNWSGETLSSVSDNNGRKLSFTYSPSNKKVSTIVGPNGLIAKYTTSGENLKQVVNAWKKTFTYEYDDLHNMIKVAFPDKTYKSLTYNKDKDWVTSLRNREGCIETYDYQVNKEDPKNHYWANVVKKCGQKVTNRSTYEFFHRPKPDGTGVFLYRTRSDVNGDITDLVYHEVFGKPISIIKNGARTDFTYFDSGLVKTRKDVQKFLAFEYKNACGKVSSVNAQYFEPINPQAANARDKKPAAITPTAAPKVVRTVMTKFKYDNPKCNMIYAENTDGQTVKLQYDSKGRISEIEDQSKKTVTIKYEERFGKPSVVSRPGMGTIQVSYKSDGQINKVDSKEGPRVAVQIASMFNNLLEIIGTASSEAAL